MNKFGSIQLISPHQSVEEHDCTGHTVNILGLSQQVLPPKQLAEDMLGSAPHQSAKFHGKDGNLITQGINQYSQRAQYFPWLHTNGTVQ